MTNIIDMPNTADTIKTAIDIIQARIRAIHAPSVVVFSGCDSREHTREILENLVAENPVYQQRGPEALANLYFDLWEKYEKDFGDDDNNDDRCVF